MDILSALYYNPASPSAFAGVNALFREAKKYGITQKQVEKFLETQPTYTRHKHIRRRFPRNKTVAVGMDSDWQADLADMQRLSRGNKGYTFLLIVVDVLSKFAWVEPLKNKTASEVAKAFDHILQQGRKPWRLYTDKGKEFIGGPFQKMLNHHGIQFIQSESPDVKASIAENFIKTLKGRIWRYFNKAKTTKYIDVLPKIMEGLNKRYHRIIKRRPIDVNFGNEREVWQTLYGKPAGEVKFRFKVGDKVRIALKKNLFQQGYLANFSEEIFNITDHLSRYPPVYKVSDWSGEPITGSYYESELVKVVENDVFEIDKVIKKRKIAGVTELFVSWKGYPKKFNSWVPELNIVSKV